MARQKKQSSRKPINPLDAVVNKLLIQLDDDLVSDDNINAKTEEYKSIINRELELAKGVSNGNIIEFNRAINEANAKQNRLIDIDSADDLGEYLSKNAGNIYQYYNERYRNKFIEAQDLNFITKFIPTLGQAVNTYVTHIVSSDDLSGSVKRNISLGSSLTQDEQAQLTQAIEAFEKEQKLQYKLKNIVIKESLITGSYYVYAPSYQKLFSEYAKTLAKNKKHGISNAPLQSDQSAFGSGTLESVDSVDINEFISDTSITYALESSEIKDITDTIPSTAFESDSYYKKMDKKKLLADGLCTVTCCESAIPFDVLEEMPDLVNNLAITDDLKDIFVNKCTPASESGVKASDGTFDTSGKNVQLKSPNKKNKNEFNISGTYIKFIDPKNVIKVRILDEIVGYFYVDSKKVSKSKANVTFTNAEWTNISKQSTVEKVANMLASKVAKQFSSKFVSKHVVFKKLIADCIMANGIINTEYRIQFIPKDDMFEFKIRENASGDGTSVLSEALWPAKLLTSIRIRKTLNYVNKSGDKLISYIKRGSADASGRNQAQRALRNMQESNITFGDIIGDSSLMFHKYAADGNIQMPVSKAGNKFIEFERMEGQTIDMSTEYEKELENQALLATGVPPLLIEQANQADFSRAYTTAHVGFAGTVASLQSDYEETLSLLYRRIVENLDIDTSIKTRASETLNIKLPRPRALSTTNGNEIVEGASRFAEQFTNLRYGEVNEDNQECIQAIRYEIVKERSPFIDWTSLEEMADKIFMEKSKIQSKNNEDGNGDDL